jgi:hypothetical protein
MTRRLPTRWRTAFEDQLGNAELRVARAEEYLTADEGGRALQEAYPAVVAAATIRVWLRAPPWEQPTEPDVMRRQVIEEFPNLFAAMASMDMSSVLTSPWPVSAAAPYVGEARAFLTETRGRFDEWIAG